MTMDELRKWGSTVTAEELARAIDSLPPTKPVPFNSFFRLREVGPSCPVRYSDYRQGFEPA